MIHEIHIENIAVIESLDIQFSSGFTVLTGETGVGKSLLIQALGLIAGARVNLDSLRAGSKQACVEARLSLSSKKSCSALMEQGYGDGEDWVIRRLIKANGKHRIYINGHMANATTLREYIAPELDVHGQDSQQRLLSPELQRILLDKYGEHEILTEKVATAFKSWQKTVEQIKNLEAASNNREQELDYLRYQLDEIERVEPKPNELQELDEHLKKIQGQAEVITAIHTAATYLNDGEYSAIERLFSVIQALRQAAPYNQTLQEFADSLDAYSLEIQTVYRRLSQIYTDTELQDIEALQERKQHLERLINKHGGDLNTLFKAQKDIYDRIMVLENIDQELMVLRQQAQRDETDFFQVAQQLSQHRQEAAERLAKKVTSDLKLLEMPHAIFSMTGWGIGEPSQFGIDQVAFTFSANPEEVAKPLKRIASGGELSRILLAIQTAIGAAYGNSTVVFDEVDAGIGGQTAMTVGARMQALGQLNQVLAVTHVPQVAAHAHQQIHIEKQIQAGRSLTVSRILEPEERVEELAGMLGFRDTATAIEHARTLLTEARQ
ncbi:DNA repair protein RecN-like [Ylistrum balloti]|uniref:DNA repair protein RecN-like n=1 Tax=Ylistrum balloti TaxID=509963 RepID=UPI002905DA2D|nr:DNA repair protein RecN-like [Ylistrum balloti]